MKKSCVFALIAAAALCLGGCQKEKPEETTPVEPTEAAAEEPELSPEEKYPATVSPYDLHPGSLNSDEDTSDRWYPEGDTNAEYYFTLTQTSQRDDCVGLSFCLYKTDGDMCDMPLRDGGNGHAITQEFQLMADKSQSFDFDFTFQDNFTCYDFKNGKVWKRCHPDYGCKDQAWYDNAFSGLVAYRDLSSVKYQQIVMNEDHTFVESVTGMDDMTGRWEVKAANVLDLIYDNPEDSGMQVIDGGSLLEDGGESGKETTYSDTWQQEFNISADGKVTEFGLFPQYDDDMNLTGYAAAFELTTKDQLEALAKEKEEAAAASKSAGSPYAMPEVDNLTQITFDTVDMEQAPDYVIDSVVWEERDDLKHKLEGDYVGYILELHGEVGDSGVNIRSTDDQHNYSIHLWHVGDGEKVQKGQKVILKGVLWIASGDPKVFYDSEHVTIVE
ncbi:MAG: hypothetical protein IK115_05750 [Lachnospiraceae bacterium]|nr:hypothetical protein [Lachnospiraceae bacterium]